MNRKRILSLLLALCLAASLLAMPAAAEEPQRSFAREEPLAYALKALGLFQGVSDIDLNLGGTPNRAQALVMMLRLMGLEADALAETGSHPFQDLDACRWAEPYIGYAFRHGLTKGISTTEFGGTRSADGQTYLTFVLRALDYEEGPFGDFLWNDPLPLARGVGLLPEQVWLEDFRRADVVSVSYAALSAKCSGRDVTLAQDLAERGVLTQAALDAYYDPAAVGGGSLAEPYAENVAAFLRETRLPLGVDISGQPISYTDAVALVGDAGFELYGFSAAGAAGVAEKIAAGAAAVEGVGRVFGIIVPNRMGAVLSYADAAALCRTSKTETEGIAYAYEQMGDKVITVDAMTNLRLHNAEEIFFRTDHHWTALGSYYAYQAWAEAAGFEPVNLDQFTPRSQSGHLGYFYSVCGYPHSMKENPDTVVAYIPHGSFTCDPAGAMDFSAWGYNTFIGGDRPITAIVNNDIADDSACVLVKDSYGNPFAVWLTQHYRTVYVIDYRYYRDGGNYLCFSDFAAQKGVTDFIILLPMTLSQSSYTANCLASYCR